MTGLEQVWRRVAMAVGDADPGLRDDERFMEGLRGYIAELVAWSGTIHLTGRSRPAETLAEQVCDSAAMLRCVEEAMSAPGEGARVRVADIGTGAGFPGIVWKIARPDWDTILIERRERLAAYLRRSVSVLGLEGAEVFEGDARALEGSRFDVVASKAAGRFSSILPLARRLVRQGGLYVTVKGDSWEAELAEAPVAGFTAVAVRPMGAGRGFALALRFSAP